jgi:hypothetical protein
MLQCVDCAPNDTSLCCPTQRILCSRTFLHGREENVLLTANENYKPLIKIKISKLASLLTTRNYNTANKQSLVLILKSSIHCDTTLNSPLKFMFKVEK